MTGPERSSSFKGDLQAPERDRFYTMLAIICNHLLGSRLEKKMFTGT
jgi:hypothetical protein